MKDHYPACGAIPPGHLVPPELQPEYLELPGDQPPRDFNLAEALTDAHVRAGRGDAPALIHHEANRQLSFSELSRKSRRLGNALLGLGVSAGDRIAFRSPNRPEPILLALAAWRVGAAIVPTPVQARPNELRYFLQDTGARALFCCTDRGCADVVPEAVAGTDVTHLVGFGEQMPPGFNALDDLLAAARDPGAAPPSPDLPAVVWHTGGTTGVPKGSYHTQRRFLLGGLAAGRATGAGAGERWAAAAPIGHALGFLVYTTFTLLQGATAVLVEEFQRPESVLDAISKRRIDTFTAISATWARLIEAIESGQPADLASLRRAYAMWQSASSTGVRDWWLERRVELLNNFGSTAFATWILVPEPGGRCPPGSLGRPAPGYRVVAVDPDAEGVQEVPAGTEGRMAVQGPTGLTYWNRPHLQARDVVGGWNLVDDLVQFDEDGNAAYLGRTDFLISTAGYKVAPVEVEEVIARHPAVREVAVVGAPDPVRQEIVLAFVAVKEGAGAGEGLRRDLLELARQRLSPYKRPRRIEFVDALPRDPVGKVGTRELKEMAARAVAGEPAGLRPGGA